MIKALIFDMGGVLIKHPRDILYKKCVAVFNVPEKKIHNAYLTLRDEYHRGTMGEKEFLGKLAAKLKVKAPRTLLWSEAYNHCYRPKKRVLSIVEALRKNYKVGLLSNAEITARNAMRNHFVHMFDSVIFSCDIGLIKPEPKMYHRIMKDLNVKASEAIFIDDKLKHVNGARAVGMHGILFKDYIKLKKELKKLKIKF